LATPHREVRSAPLPEEASGSSHGRQRRKNAAAPPSKRRVPGSRRQRCRIHRPPFR